MNPANTALYEHLMDFRPGCSSPETYIARGRMDHMDGALAELTALSVVLGRQLLIEDPRMQEMMTVGEGPVIHIGLCNSAHYVSIFHLIA
ncbi:hypothetical protein BLNAU_3427 [Blattamonas nauphoetae]|uniref:Uncharacterized protein n=1 Tax=Blattamonas nauphoetae TaxID=2049346 RepID=A0ABQ9YD22_9EUKA|nr:hypothetical protein BLNAU_3427 [Blattamonas nauphoetae]